MLALARPIDPGLLFGFARDVLEALRVGLAIRADLFQVVAARGDPVRVSAAVAILGGASLLAGESVVLFLNQVRRVRFALSLLLNGVLFALTLAAWAISIRAVGFYALGVDPPVRVVIALVGLGAAPFVFGFLVLAPYFGPTVARVLYVWSLLIIVRSVAHTFGVGLVEATACVGIGWVLVLVLGRTVGRPVVHVRNLIWRRLVGPQPRGSAQDILAEALEATAGEPGGPT